MMHIRELEDKTKSFCFGVRPDHFGRCVKQCITKIELYQNISLSPNLLRDSFSLNIDDMMKEYPLNNTRMMSSCHIVLYYFA